MSEKSERQAAEILERFSRFGINPNDKYDTLYDAIIGLLDIADEAYEAGRKAGREEQREKDADKLIRMKDEESTGDGLRVIIMAVDVIREQD